MLAYAFGDRIAPEAGRLGGKTMPCTGSKISGPELAVTMLHVALWDLIRRGRVRLEDAEKKVLFVRSRSIRVRPAPDARLDEEIKGSLEYDLLKTATSGRRDRELREVVRRLYPDDADDPFGRVFLMQNLAMINAGLMRLEPDGPNGAAGRARGDGQTLVWLCDRMAEHESEFRAVNAEWRRYRDEQRPAFDAIRRTIKNAVASRRKRSKPDIEAS